MLNFPPLNIQYPPNTLGNDYFVGDIHGEYNVLFNKLSCLGFDFEKDRLFSVGDLVNKGPYSKKTLMLLKESWFFSVAGNHEIMLMESAMGLAKDDDIDRVGAGWIKSCSLNKLNEFSEIISKNTSLSATLNTGLYRVGIVHAAAPSDWSVLENKVPLSMERELWKLCTTSFCQGSSAQQGIGKKVENIDFVVSGHISTDNPVLLENHVWIDTYSRSGNLIVLPMEDLAKIIEVTK